MTNSSSDAAAFPSGDFTELKPMGGLTKREWFAGMAMQAEIISTAIYKNFANKDFDESMTILEIAEEAYRQADAMLAASERGEG